MWSEGIIGQENVVKHLQDALQNGRIPHAQLFLGKPGHGTLQVALHYARAILCQLKDGELQQEETPSSLSKFRKFIHPDLHFVFPVNRTNDVSHDKMVSDDLIEAWRELLTQHPFFDLHDWYHHIGIGNRQGLITVNESSSILRKLSLKPFESEYKVMIIWCPDKMNIQAANKLLKLLEEPPERTVFLLVAEDTDSLLQTIVSRTQITRVPPLSREDVARGLIQFNASDSDAKAISRMAHGDLRRAIHLHQKDNTNNDQREEFSAWMRLCFSKKVSELIHWSESKARNSREDLKAFLEYGLHLFRESLIINYGNAEVSDLDPNEDGFLAKFAPYVNQNNCLNFISEFDRAINEIGRNANAKIVLFDLSIKVMQQIRIKEAVS